MRAVLYSYDFEPITVIYVPEWARQHMEQHQCFAMAVFERLPVRPCDYEAPATRSYRIVRIQCERLRRGYRSHWMLFTEDEESALLLRTAFLPGQLGEVQERQREAFSKGFWAAVQLGGLGGL